LKQSLASRCAAPVSGARVALSWINGSRLRRASSCQKRMVLVVRDRREILIKWTVGALALVLASSALAMPRVPLQAPNDIIIKVWEACGATMHRVNVVCIRTPARRGASRCARGVTC
jgi:hypothetical protein